MNNDLSNIKYCENCPFWQLGLKLGYYERFCVLGYATPSINELGTRPALCKRDNVLNNI